jgi:hypothetical protein
MLEISMKLRIKNWAKFQHFKDRRPPWVKLYRDILDDREWHRLEPSAAKVLVMLWLIASESDGYLPDSDELAFRLRITETEVIEAISGLGWWLEQVDDTGDIACDDDPISDGYQEDRLEKRREETETEEETEKKPRAARFDPQACLESWGTESGVARDWLAVRKAKRLTATETALNGVKAEADKAGVSMDEALRTCCLRGWGGFKADWLTNQANGRMNGHSDNPFA